MRRRAPLAALLGAVTAVPALWPVPALKVENPERGTAAHFATDAGRRFTVASIHSMYDEPVEEEFEIAGGRIELHAVSSRSAAVREYFGLTGPGERHLVHRSMEQIVFRVAMGAPQRLRLSGAEHSFREFGEPGDRLVLRAVRRPLATLLLGGAL